MRTVFSTFLKAGIFSAIIILVFLYSHAPGTRDFAPPEPATFAPSPVNTRLVGPLDLSGPYITINVVLGEINLRTRDSVLLTARCSAGSGATFKDPLTLRAWDFSTPNGLFVVRRKAENPIWRKPDWAFLEEGLPVPDDPADRLVEDELGDYSLDLGDGLFIHGTIYTRLLGMNVTHGCIRVGDDDLQRIYEAVQVGTPVILFGGTEMDASIPHLRRQLEIDCGRERLRFTVGGFVVWDAPFSSDHTPTQLSGGGIRRINTCQRQDGAAFSTLLDRTGRQGRPPHRQIFLIFHNLTLNHIEEIFR